jgi:hypothetical protein
VTDWPGNINAYRRDDGTVRLDVTPGALRVTRGLIDQADPEWLSWAGDLVTFHSVEPGGVRRAYRYRIVGSAPGPEGGWLLTVPVEEVAEMVR